jgi:hypothetical protein
MMYLILTRQADGSWTPDLEERTLREANKIARFNRIMGGIQSRTFPAKEYYELHPELISGDKQ